MIFRSVGHVQVAAIALFAAVLAILWGCIFIIFGNVLHVQGGHI